MLENDWESDDIQQIENEVEKEISSGIDYAKQSAEMTNEEFLTFIDAY